MHGAARSMHVVVIAVATTCRQLVVAVLQIRASTQLAFSKLRTSHSTATKSLTRRELLPLPLLLLLPQQDEITGGSNSKQQTPPDQAELPPSYGQFLDAHVRRCGSAAAAAAKASATSAHHAAPPHSHNDMHTTAESSAHTTQISLASSSKFAATHGRNVLCLCRILLTILCLSCAAVVVQLRGPWVRYWARARAAGAEPGPAA
jgi:hypothetical protein